MATSLIMRGSKVKGGGEPRPALFAGLLFLLLYSGPPKFRYRDPTASLSGEVDPAILVAVVVWLIAGVWVASQLWLIYTRERPGIRLSLVHKLSLALIALLAASTFVSVSPALTAFKVYQIVVEFLFVTIFIERYGIRKSLRLMFWACVLLCLAISIAMLLAPELVLEASESGFPRLRGEAIADTGIVATFGLILLFTRMQAMWKPLFFVLAAFLGAMLFLSLSRSAWGTTLICSAVALWKRPELKRPKWIFLFWIPAGLALALGGGLWMFELRDPESLYTLSGRIGLWELFLNTTWTTSPWLGLGYVAGARELGMDYVLKLGSGHSILFDVFVGGGILSLAVFLVLVGVLSAMALKLLRKSGDSVSFAGVALFVGVLLPGLIGADIDASPSGFTFWSLVTMLPLLAGASDGVRLKRPVFPTPAAARIPSRRSLSAPGAQQAND